MTFNFRLNFLSLTPDNKVFEPTPDLELATAICPGQILDVERMEQAGPL